MNKIKLILLKIYLWLNNDKFKYIKRIKFHNNDIKEVVIFKNKKSLFKGQAIPLLNVIIIEESLFNKYSTNTQNFILEHEYAHTKLNWVINLVLLPIFIFFGISAISSLFILLFYIFLAILIGKISLFIAITYTILFLISIFLFGLISWVVELHADINAIKSIGLVNAKKAYKEMLKKKEKNIIERIINRITHPPLKWVFYIYKKSLRN